MISQDQGVVVFPDSPVSNRQHSAVISFNGNFDAIPTVVATPQSSSLSVVTLHAISTTSFTISLQLNTSHAAEVAVGWLATTASRTAKASRTGSVDIGSQPGTTPFKQMAVKFATPFEPGCVPSIALTPFGSRRPPTTNMFASGISNVSESGFSVAVSRADEHKPVHEAWGLDLKAGFIATASDGNCSRSSHPAAAAAATAGEDVPRSGIASFFITGAGPATVNVSFRPAPGEAEAVCQVLVASPYAFTNDRTLFAAFQAAVPGQRPARSQDCLW